MAAALGLAAGSDLPIVPVGSLEVLAYPWRSGGSPIIVVSGHRRGHAYFAAYEWTGERFRTIIAPANPSLEEILGLVRGLAADRLLFAGDALDSLAGEIRLQVGQRACFMPSVSARAADVAALAADPLRPRWTGHDREGRTPDYLRDADARKPRRRI